MSGTRVQVFDQDLSTYRRTPAESSLADPQVHPG